MQKNQEELFLNILAGGKKYLYIFKNSLLLKRCLWNLIFFKDFSFLSRNQEYLFEYLCVCVFFCVRLSDIFFLPDSFSTKRQKNEFWRENSLFSRSVKKIILRKEKFFFLLTKLFFQVKRFGGRIKIFWEGYIYFYFFYKTLFKNFSWYFFS